MGYSTERARYEQALARAHRALSWAEETAYVVNDDDGAYDLHLMQVEVIRLATQSLKNKPSVHARQQTLPGL